MDAIAALQLVERMHARLVARRPSIQKSEDYYSGKQPLNFATREWRRKNADRYSGFSDNWCGPVADAEAERILHTGLVIPDSDAAGRTLWSHWLRNEMEMQSSQGWLSSLVSSRSFVTVWGDDEDRPTIDWQHAGNVEIEYDASSRRRKVAMLKSWIDDDFEYATLYTPSEVFKFRRDASKTHNDGLSQAKEARIRQRSAAAKGSWKPFEPNNETWPLPNPMGVVPGVEMPNRPILGADPRSEIEGVIAMQDAVNLLWAYLFLAADYASMTARVVTGQAPPKMPILDSEGKKIGERPISMDDLQEKRLLFLTSTEAKIDQFDAAKLDVFTDVIEVAVGHIAAQTRTPPTYLVSKTGMSNVNAEGLKASEIGLVNKTREFQRYINPALRDLYKMIALADGDQALAEQAELAQITWRNPEIRSDAQLADALTKKKSYGYPFEALLMEEGKSPDEIDKILQMRRDEMLDPQIAAAMRTFDAEVANVDAAGNI